MSLVHNDPIYVFICMYVCMYSLKQTNPHDRAILRSLSYNQLIIKNTVKIHHHTESN